MDFMFRPLAWAAGALVFGVADLYAVGGSFTQADLLLMALGALPAVAFGLFVVGSRDSNEN